MPATPFPEFAFIGRSNVGKSSLINMLCHRTGLVKISNTPGKTRTINFFLINESFHLIDLPGYGFAKVSAEQRKQWEGMIENYLTQRKQLYCVFALIDSRHPPQKLDIDFVNQLGQWQIPFALVFTKTDKQSRNKTMQHVNEFLSAMKMHWEVLPKFFLASATTKSGGNELWALIDEISK